MIWAYGLNVEKVFKDKVLQELASDTTGTHNKDLGAGEALMGINISVLHRCSVRLYPLPAFYHSIHSEL